MTVEYPSLKGKVIKQVRFTQDDDEFTALSLEFDDDTQASFVLKSAVTLAMEPELSKLRDGNIVDWRKLKPQAVKLRRKRLRQRRKSG